MASHSIKKTEKTVKDVVKETIELPAGVSASIAGDVLTVKGPKGEVTRNIGVPQLDIVVDAKHITITVDTLNKREKKLLFTFKAHIKNMVKGTSEGHVYKLRICSGHFPMNVTIKGHTIEIKNFLGEKVPRILTFSDKVSVVMDGKDLTVTGVDKELTSQVAASIEQLTKRVGFDRRIFQDGIYIIEKDGKPIA